MKCSHLSILAFVISLPACEPSSDTLDHDESTGSDDWGMTDEKIAPLEDEESSETGRTAEPTDLPEEEENESASLSQDESSSSEEESSSESSDTSTEDEETGEETGDNEESTSDTGDETGDVEESTGGGKPWEIAEVCYAECRADESLDSIRAERDAYNEMPRGGDFNELTCARDVVELRVRALFQQAAIDCRDECDLWRWTDIDRDVEVCTHEETEFLNACYAKYECKLPRQPGHSKDDSLCELSGRRVWDYCIRGWDNPEDISAIPDLRDFECYSDCHGSALRDQFNAGRVCESQAEECGGDRDCACEQTPCGAAASGQYKVDKAECWDECGYQEGDVDLKTGCEGECPAGGCPSQEECEVRIAETRCLGMCAIEYEECVGHGTCESPIPRDCNIARRECGEGCIASRD